MVHFRPEQWFTLNRNKWFTLIRNNQLKDNDLRYRYIKSTNGITLENLYKLENIFQYNRDKKLIREIKKEVEEYEREVQKAAKEIESKRLKTQKK